MSQSDHSWLARVLQAETRLVARHPMWVVLAAAVVAVACLVVAATQLTFKTNRLDLLNPDSQFNQRWLAYLADFGDADDAVLVVRGAPRRVKAALDGLVTRLEEAALPPNSVLGRPDFTRLAAAGLHLMPIDDLRQLEQRLSTLPQDQQQWSQLGALSLMTQANHQLGAADTEENVQFCSEAVQAVLSALRTPARYHSVWDAITPSPSASEYLPQYLTSDDGQMGFVLVQVPRDNGVPSAERVELIRETKRSVQANFPGVEFGLTGVPILEHDEMRSSQQDMGKSTAISLAGVALLFTAGFGGLRLPLLAVVNLVVALCWCMAYITLGVGHLNILSVAFGAILIGLGIDFGVHLVAAYAELRGAHDSSESALVAAVGQVGPGIVTGGLTSAMAFCTAILTDFTGVAELGRIAGGGMVLCMLSSLFVLPALIQLSENGRDSARLPAPLPAGILSAAPSAAPKFTLVLMTVVTLGLASRLPNLEYDHNLLNLQPVQSESVRWERAIVEHSGHGQWYALSVCDDLSELRRRRKEFLTLATVQRTESIEPLLGGPTPKQGVPPSGPSGELPRDGEDSRELADALERAAILQRLQTWASRLPAQAQTQESPDGVQLVAAQLAATEQLAHPKHSELAAIAAETRNHLFSGASQPPNQRAYDTNTQKLHALSFRMAEDLLHRLRRLSEAASAPRPQLSDLPPELLARYVGKSGKFLLKVHAAGSARDMEGLRAFVQDVERVDPRCTGHPVQTFYASRQMQKSFLHAAIYSLLAVAAVLMLDFRSIRMSLLAMAPMALGLLQLLGMLSWLGITLNPANMIVLPLIMGIGIDDGVHVVHDYRRQRGRFRLGDTTATAVLVTSATTMVGFGSMMISRHQGLHSLGQVLTLGVFCCLINSLVVLPAILSFGVAGIDGIDGVDGVAGKGAGSPEERSNDG